MNANPRSAIWPALLTILLVPFSGLPPGAGQLATIPANALAAASFYCLLAALGQTHAVAMTASLLFAVHPLHIVGVSTAQSAASSLASLAMFAWGWRAASWLLAAAALCSSDTAILLPAIVFSLAFLENSESRRWPAALRASLPYIVIDALYAIARETILPPPSLVAIVETRSPWELPAVIAANVKAMFFPFPLTFHRELPGPAVVFGVWFAMGVLVVAAMRLPQLRNDLALAAALMFLPLIPNALLAPDRPAYAATAGACFLVSSSFARFIHTSAQRWDSRSPRDGKAKARR